MPDFSCIMWLWQSVSERKQTILLEDKKIKMRRSEMVMKCENGR